MQSEILEQLAHLDAQASPGPWSVVQLNDDVCMSMIAITNSDVAADRLGGSKWKAEF